MNLSKKVSRYFIFYKTSVSIILQAEAKSAHAMGVLVPWDYHSGKLLQQRVKRKAGYGHIGYSLEEIELMFSNVVNCIDDFSRAKALKPFETLAARITDQVSLLKTIL